MSKLRVQSQTIMSSLLRTKNSSKLVKKFLQRTNEWQTDEPSKKKRKRLHDTSTSKRVVDEEQIVQQHIQTLLTMDYTMKRPPVKSLQKNPDKQSKIDISMRRLEREAENDKKKKKTATSILVMGSSRSSAAESHVVHEPTYNKKHHTKEQKKRHLENLARVLKKSSKKKSKSKK